MKTLTVKPEDVLLRVSSVHYSTSLYVYLFEYSKTWPLETSSIHGISSSKIPSSFDIHKRGDCVQVTKIHFSSLSMNKLFSDKNTLFRDFWDGRLKLIPKYLGYFSMVLSSCYKKLSFWIIVHALLSSGFRLLNLNYE